jgi:hypothetical protein
MYFQSEREKEKITKVNSFVKSLTGLSLEKFISSSTWQDKEVALKLIKNNISSEDKQYLYSTITNAHILDNRTQEQYCLNVTLSWAIEDAIMFALKKSKQSVIFSGTDGTRGFNSFSSNTPDIYFPKSQKYFEIITNYYSGFKETKTIALRDNKYENLIMFNSGVILYDFSTKAFYVVENIAKEKPVTTKYNYSFGKKTTSIKIEDEPLTIQKLIKWLSLFS